MGLAGLSSIVCACRAYSQLLSQAMLEHFPGLLGPSCSPELRAMADYFETCPSVRKLDNIKATVFREVLPGSARVPSRILSQVCISCLCKFGCLARDLAHRRLRKRWTNGLKQWGRGNFPS